MCHRTGGICRLASSGIRERLEYPEVAELAGAKLAILQQHLMQFQDDRSILACQQLQQKLPLPRPHPVGIVEPGEHDGVFQMVERLILLAGATVARLSASIPTRVSVNSAS